MTVEQRDQDRPEWVTPRPPGDALFPLWPEHELIGREHEVDRLVDLIEAGARLICVTGPGGVGKTRLVIHVARQLAAAEARRVILVPLADLHAAVEIVPAIAAAIEVRLVPSDAAGDAIPDELADELAVAGTLLVLDNAEHLRDLPLIVGQLLAMSPGPQIVVTSQRRLNLGIETEFAVAPLALPDRPSVLQSGALAPALELFRYHARRAWPEFALNPATAPIVAEICRQVDGVPLAIELAAARLRILSLVQLRDRLAAGLPALGGGPRDLPARQQTIRGAIAWGYDLLLPPEQLLFRRLAVFVDGFDLDAAEAICVDAESGAEPALTVGDIVDLLAVLEDASLLTAETRSHGRRRFRMLGIIRRFALEQLGVSGELDLLRQRHAVWFAERAVAAEGALLGGEQADWLAWLDGNAANLRAAEETAFTLGPVADGVRLVGSLWRYWDIRGQLAEARRAMERALPFLESVPPAARATLQTSLGHVVSDLGEYARAERLYSDALAIRRDGDDPGQVAGLLNILGILLQTRGELTRARALHQESLGLRTARDEPRGIALSLLNLGRVAYHLGDYDRAAAQESEAVVILNHLGDQDQIAYACHAVGLTSIRLGHLSAAGEMLTRSERLFVGLGDRFGVAYARQALGHLALQHGDVARAASLMGQALDLRRDIGYVWGVVDSTQGIGELAALAGRRDVALRLLLTAERFRQRLGAPLNAVDGERHRLTVARLRRELGRARSAEEASLALSLSREQAADLAFQLSAEPAVAAPATGDRPALTRPAARSMTMPASASEFGLTVREREVLSLVAEGRSDREIADQLFLSRRTVSEHVRHILAKLGTPTRTAATALAFRTGLI